MQFFFVYDHQSFIFKSSDKRTNLRKVMDSKEGHGFLIRESPVPGRRVCSLNEAKIVKDYDVPELVVFLYEDHKKFVKDICIDRGDSTKGKCVLGECRLDQNTPCFSGFRSDSSNSSRSEFTPTCIKDVNVNTTYESSSEHPTRKKTSEALGEIFRDDEFSRSFSLKHWQKNAFSRTISSRKEYPHYAEYQQFPKAKNLSTIPLIGNLQTLTSSGESFDLQTDNDPDETSRDTSKSEMASHQSNDSSISSNSFSFPIISPEWKGSPVKMVKADRRLPRKRRWRKICNPCCKF
ncbi:uncharacterized protein LOC107471824 [Arachis duranensis]|uniref:Uncharacterized protein LOC107471824 n=1 Tax=Arachis duranensis TaxID=130453 RepID=A0A6P4BVL1_ARADU|nr:uncharacterized protein LOC107471824 [Arachis duranensis]